LYFLPLPQVQGSFGRAFTVGECSTLT